VAELPDSVAARVDAHCAKGDALAKQRQFDKALAEYEAAWAFLPEPKADWEAALWILAAIGDTHFLSGDWEACQDALQEAVQGCAGALENPFIRLRLGQSLFELGERPEAANWMAPAFLMEGTRLFEAEDPKYLAFLKRQLQPPPGGWPEGW
jgi:tetratricopeptide (TPR) repeat protein